LILACPLRQNSKPDDSSFDSGTFLGGFFVQRQQTKNKIDTSWLAVRGKSVKNNEKKRQREALRVSLQGERLSKRPLLRGSF
jgi:hypothetical protein